MRTVTKSICTHNMLFMPIRLRNQNTLCIQNRLCLLCVLACLFAAGCAVAEKGADEPVYSLPPMTKVQVTVGDTGENKSVIIRDMNNPDDLQGYIHIPILSGADVPVTVDYVNDLNGLARGMAIHTGITTTIDPALSLSDPGILSYPFLYLRMIGDRLTGPEKEVLGAYLNGSGFLILDSSSAQDIVRSVEGIALQRIPTDHAIYIAPFPIDTGVVGETGIFHGDRLVGIASHSYGGSWDSPETYDRQIKRAINCIVHTMKK
jgi:hypothetical protein